MIKAPRSERIDQAISLMDDVYQYDGVGGNLHIVLDDKNVNDDSIKWCLTDAIGKYDRSGMDEEDNEASRTEVEIELANLLLTMTVFERLAVVYHNDIEDRLWEYQLEAYEEELEAEGIIKMRMCCVKCGLPVNDCNKNLHCSGEEANQTAVQTAEELASGLKERESRQRRCEECKLFYSDCTCPL